MQRSGLTGACSKGSGLCLTQAVVCEGAAHTCDKRNKEENCDKKGCDHESEGGLAKKVNKCAQVHDVTHKEADKNKNCPRSGQLLDAPSCYYIEQDGNRSDDRWVQEPQGRQ